MNKKFDQGVQDHDVLIVILNFPGGKRQMSSKLDLCGANEVDIRKQRPRLRKNTLFLNESGGVKQYRLLSQ